MRELVLWFHSQIVKCANREKKLLEEYCNEVIVRRIFVLEKCHEDLSWYKPNANEKPDERDAGNEHAHQSKKHATDRVDN